MRKPTLIALLILTFSLLLLSGGCDKEKIVTSTEYVHDIEYLEVPGDTVFRIDTVYSSDSTTIIGIDTVHVYDTVSVNSTDTVVQTIYIHDTTTVTVTVTVTDTVTTTEYVYDTTVQTEWSANELTAMGAVQYNTNDLVLEFINTEFGYTDGWVFYLTSWQSDITAASSTVYDIYGYIDYWTPDWEAYYPLEYYYRVTYTGGDPSNMSNWQFTEPPTTGARQPGVHILDSAERSRQDIR